MIKIQLIKGDIIKVKADAVINAANTTLCGSFPKTVIFVLHSDFDYNLYQKLLSIR